MFKNILSATILAIVAASSSVALAEIRITEWMYSPLGGPGEYFELTNVGNVPVDMSGWSQDDNTRRPGVHPLGAFGIVQPGESVIGTETTDVAAFQTYWNLPLSVKVIGYGSVDNIGRSDEINLYDNFGALVDQLTYSDSSGLGPRTQGTSGNIPLAFLGTNTASAAVLSAAGDSFLSYRGGGGSGDLGNPGLYTPFVSVPEPASAAILLIGAVGFAARRRS